MTDIQEKAVQRIWLYGEELLADAGPSAEVCLKDVLALFAVAAE